jgi:hypothetical protein
MNDTSIIDAAVELCVFCKTHGYPSFPSDNFFILTDLIDKLDTALRKNGLMPEQLTTAKSEENQTVTTPWIDPKFQRKEWYITPIAPKPETPK